MNLSGPNKHHKRCEQERLNTFWKSGEFTKKSEITLRDHFIQAICAVRHSLCLFTLDNMHAYLIDIKLKAVCLSVHIFPQHADNSQSVISAWIDSGLGLCDSCVLWHEQVCFYKSVSALCWAHECLKGTAVAPFCHA